MRPRPIRELALALMLTSMLVAAPAVTNPTFAQEQTAAADTQAPAPLSDEEMQILVARIALYPDELVSVIAAASLYPLQVVEAARFLDKQKSDPNLKPKDDWDGSVISLLNYPEIVKMMSDDLDWTQQLGEAITNQEKDVLVAIQQLREEAVAKGVIKTDDKVKVVKEEGNIVIQPASQEVIYVPQYEPAMLYDPGYVAAPIAYYPTAYPSYYYPTAPFFAGFVTGMIWGAVVDWNRWGIWGGPWGNDININCKNCFNNRDFNGKLKWNDVDWKNVDRSKISFDKADFQKLDRSQLKKDLESGNRNKLSDKANQLNKTSRDLTRDRQQVKDVRKSTLEGLKQKPQKLDRQKPAQLDKAKLPAAKDLKKPAAKDKPAVNKNKIDREIGKPKAATRADNRPKTPSGLGEFGSGKKSQLQSNRGNRSMNGAMDRGNVKPRMSGGRRR